MSEYLTLKILGGGGFNDKSPAAGCCGEPKTSWPMAYFMIPNAAAVWATKPSPRIGHEGKEEGEAKVKWENEFTHVKCRDIEGALITVFVVDGRHWKPNMKDPQDPKNRNPPRQHFYGSINIAAMSFAREKRKNVDLTLKSGTDGQGGLDTKHWVTVEAWFKGETAIERGDGIKIDYNDAGPPAQGMGGAPYGGAKEEPKEAGPWDKRTWPPILTKSDVQAAHHQLPIGAGNCITQSGQLPAEPLIGTNIGGANSNADPGDEIWANLHDELQGPSDNIVYMQNCRVWKTKIWGKAVLVKCDVEKIRVGTNGEAYFFNCTNKKDISSEGGKVEFQDL